MIFETLIIAFLMIVAIVLILLEIFMLPGITVAGVGGFLFAAGGLFYAYSVSTPVGNVTLAISLCSRPLSSGCCVPNPSTGWL